MRKRHAYHTSSYKWPLHDESNPVDEICDKHSPTYKQLLKLTKKLSKILPRCCLFLVYFAPFVDYQESRGFTKLKSGSIRLRGENIRLAAGTPTKTRLGWTFAEKKRQLPGSRLAQIPASEIVVSNVRMRQISVKSHFARRLVDWTPGFNCIIRRACGKCNQFADTHRVLTTTDNIENKTRDTEKYWIH